MLQKKSVFVLALLMIATGGCTIARDLLENGEYKPAIMVDSNIYWLAPSGSVDDIPDNCEVVDQIRKVSSPTQLPDEDYEAIGFFGEFLGADIYQSEDGAFIFVFNPEIEEYIPFELAAD